METKVAIKLLIVAFCYGIFFVFLEKKTLILNLLHLSFMFRLQLKYAFIFVQFG